MRRCRGMTLAGATAAVICALLTFGCSGGSSEPGNGGSGKSQGGATGELNGETVMNTKCTMCHTLDRIVGAEKTRTDWESTIERMESNGLVITDEEKSAVLDYLVSR